MGDVNNDQHNDIIVANCDTNSIGIFLSNGDGTFQDQQTVTTDAQSRPYSIVITDFNHDQHLDVAVAYYDTNSVGIFLGHGNGTFHGQKLFSLGSSHPLFVSASDFNNDNQTDLVTANYGTDSISILFGYGNGLFYDQKIYHTGYDSFPSSIGVGDFNRDNQLDLAVANSGTDNIGIFLAHENGIFFNQVIYTTGHNSHPSSLVIEDFNYDHHLDIAVSCMGLGKIEVFLGYGNGSFRPPITYSITFNFFPDYITFGYLNNDRILDLAIIDSQSDRIHILHGYGNGSFATSTIFDTISGSSPIGMCVTDINNNNQSDLVVANYGTSSVLALKDYFFEPSAWQKNYGIPGLGGSGPVAIGDFNNDSNLDIVFAIFSKMFILTGLGNGSFDLDTMRPIEPTSYTQYMCVGDLNNDGHIDIISANSLRGYIQVFLGYGNGTFATRSMYVTDNSTEPQWLALGDVNDDNIVDIVYVDRVSRIVGMLIGNGDGRFVTGMNFTTFNNLRPYSVAVGRIDHDDHLDIVVADEGGRITIFLGYGNGSFIFHKDYSVSSASLLFSVVLADFNSDNYLDIVVAETDNDHIVVLLGYGDGTYAVPTAYSTGVGSQPLYIMIANFNNDHVSDIAVTNNGNDEVVIFYGYDNGSFHLARTYSTGFNSKPYGIAAGDFDNDQQLEIVVAFLSTSTVAVLTEYVAAKFVEQSIYSTGPALHSTSVAIGDFNNDNQLDVVVANSGTDNLNIRLGLGNGTFVKGMTYSVCSNSQPRHVITCDINEDNHLDIISVNAKSDSISVLIGYGNGTFADQIIYLTGSGTYPYAVVSGDINNDGRMDLVVANEGTDEIGIFYGFNYISFHDQVIYPNIHQEYPTKIITSDFNNDHYLDVAVVFEHSDSFGILFGHGNGSFTNARIYPIVNGSRPSGITVGDINHDTYLDIVVANGGTNSISVFLGYGHGLFASVMTYSTGSHSGPIDITIGDCNNDHHLDIIVVNRNTFSIGVFLGNGNGIFSSVKTYLIAQNFLPCSGTIGDFNNDNNLDMAVVSDETNSVAVLLGYGDGTFVTQWTWSTVYYVRYSSISVGDFNRDNQLDIAAANYNANGVSIMFGYGNGTFSEKIVFYYTGTGSLPKRINVGDFNDDNMLDIAAVNMGTHEIVVLFGLGDGRFVLGKPHSTGFRSAPQGLTIGDFNNDSRLDIAVANSALNNIGVFLQNGTEPFGSITIAGIGVGSQPHSVAIGDIDSDGSLEIVVANFGTGNVATLEVWQHGLFEVTAQYSTGSDSSPYSVALVDVNNDTHLDILVTNSGTDNIKILLGDGNGTFVYGETYPTGTRSRPYMLTVADFNNDHILDITLVNFDASNILVLYGYGNGTFGNETTFHLGYGYHPYSIGSKRFEPRSSRRYRRSLL